MARRPPRTPGTPRAAPKQASNATKLYEKRMRGGHWREGEEVWDLGEEVDGAEEEGAEVGVPRAATNGGLVLDDPEGEVDGDPIVPEEVDVLPTRTGLEQVPESARDPHGRAVAAAAARLASSGGSWRRR